MLVKVVLVDGTSAMIEAWREAFRDHAEVDIKEGAIVDSEVSAWIVGELDDELRTRFGSRVEAAFEARTAAVCVATGHPVPGYVIAAPAITDDALSVVSAMAAALQAVHTQNAAAPGSIVSVALSALGADRFSPQICAELTWSAYDLFRHAHLPDPAVLERALDELFADLDPNAGPGAYKKSFGDAMRSFDDEATVPDSAAAQAQLKKKLSSIQTRLSGDDDDL